MSHPHDSITIEHDKISEGYRVIKNGGLIVCPTRVGYILAGTTANALHRKYKYKERPLHKPAVVLTGHGQLEDIAHVAAVHRPFIDRIEREKLLCGFILTRKEEAFSQVEEGARELSRRPDGTSCFVINHGLYSEHLVSRASQDEIFVFASSANPSGTGNRGRFANIGAQILDHVDLAIEDDAYVAQRYRPESGEQGVMINLVTPLASLIRKGLADDQISDILAEIYGPDGWLYDHGAYA